jgi:hypothetical protein
MQENEIITVKGFSNNANMAIPEYISVCVDIVFILLNALISHFNLRADARLICYMLLDFAVELLNTLCSFQNCESNAILAVTLRV